MFDLSDPSAPSLSSVVYLLAGDFVRDGMDHAAEPVVELILRRDRDAAVGAFVDLVLSGDRCGADLVRLLGRSTAFGAATSALSSSRLRLLEFCLRSDSADVRDAGMVAPQRWGDASLAPALRGHLDDQRWLTDYALEVATHLESGVRDP